MKRREFTPKQRFAIIKRATTEDNRILCEGCSLNVTFKKWEIDHVVAEALVIDKSKPLTIEDGKLLGHCCHRGENGKTAKDMKAIAKSKRREAKHFGFAKKRSTFPKMPEGYRYDWRTRRPVKIDGSVVRRDA